MIRLIAAAALAAWVPANASLVDIPGTNFSFDDATGLYWLDVRVTNGESIEGVVGGQPSWRWATSTEVRSLFENAASDAGMISLADGLGGYTGNFVGQRSYDFVEGIFSDNGLYGVGRIEVFRSNGEINYKFGLQDGIQFNPGAGISYNQWPYSGGAGHFLVSQVAPVPEPAGYVMACISFVALFIARRRSRLGTEKALANA